MLYLDASALVKRYFNEKGSKVITARFETGEKIFTSILSFSEVHTTIARKFRLGELDFRATTRLREIFEHDWLSSLSVLDMDLRTMSALPRLVEKYPLRAGDAIHLSTAFWLQNSIQRETPRDGTVDPIEFGASDRRLCQAAFECGFQVFDPEDQN